MTPNTHIVCHWCGELLHREEHTHDTLHTTKPRPPLISDECPNNPITDNNSYGPHETSEQVRYIMRSFHFNLQHYKLFRRKVPVK